MRFRISQRRGVFKLQQKTAFQICWRTLTYHHSSGGKFQLVDEHNYIVPFLGYEAAVSYIRQHYGTEGVGSIDKPDWVLV